MRTNRFKLIWREIAVASPTTKWLPPLLVSGGLFLLADTQSDNPMRYEYVFALVEIIIPLGVMFLSSGLILRELDENTLVFVAVRSSLVTLWLRRLGALLLTSTFWLSILLIIYRLFYLPLSISQMLLASISVSLALIGVSNVIALILREMNAGYLIGIFMWSICLIADRFAFDILGPRLYLFYLWFSIRENIGTEAWFLNKLALASMGMAFILISTLLLRSTERFIAR